MVAASGVGRFSAAGVAVKSMASGSGVVSASTFQGLAGRRLGEGVLADLHRSQELLGFEAAHRAGHGVHRHVLQVETVEDALVCAALVHVGLDEAFLVEGEGVGVLHDELAAADQAGARTELVAVLGLDLVQGRGQVLVRGIHVLHQQGEHFLVRGSQQVVATLAIVQLEEGRAVLLQRFVAL